ncbi:MAG: hypothetical protein P1V51_12960 [Deltaproteobacteria bacterium]|nr:hypothetical protein [Deltaproteobacteria bacterium]
MKRGQLIWLGLLAILLGVAAWLMDVEEMPRAHRAEKMDFPRGLDDAERQRMVRRQVLPERTPPAPADEQQPPPPPRPRDPLLAAFPGGEGGMAVVGELNALRHSPVGEMVLSCLGDKAWGEIEKFKDEIGIDPLEDLDRFGFSGETAYLTGDFASVDWDKLMKGDSPIHWGEKGEIYERGSEVLGVWDDQLVVLGRDRAEVQAAIDRLEGRAEAGAPTIAEHQTYGDVYGVVGAEAIARLLERDQDEISRRIREVAKQVSFHLDASKDVAMVLDLEGSDRESVDELARSLAGAISAGRIAAQEQGEEALADLLDFARVVPKGESFTLELALPESYLAEHLGSCKWVRPDPDARPEDPLQGEME